MAYNQEPNLRFIPYRPGDFKNNRPIQQGGQLTTPWQKGIQDLIYNQLTLWGQTAPPVIQDSRTCLLTLPVQNTYYDFAMYRYDTPGLLNPGAASGRRYLQITVRALTTGAHAWQFQARTSSGVTVTSASSGAGGLPVQVTANCEIPQSALGDWVILSIRCTTAAQKAILISQVTARVLPASAAALGEGTALYTSNQFRPLDSSVGQGSEGYPLTVRAVQDLIFANQSMFESNIRGVINYSAWDVFSTLTNPTTTVAALSNGVNINTFVGAGVLNVASTTGFPPWGKIQVTTGSGVFSISYTGTTATTFTGCQCNGQAGVMSTGGAIMKDHVCSMIQTTIAPASNGVNINTFAGAGVLNVGSTTGAASAGVVLITTGGGVFPVSYTGISATTFTGCHSNGAAGVMATGGAVMATGSALGFTFDPDTSNKIMGHQWIYYPRQGVRNLRLYLDGYVQGWASSSDTASLAFGFANRDPQIFTIAKATYLTGTSAWPAEGLLVPVPNESGPLFLDLRRTDVRMKPCKIMSMAVFEENR